MYDDDTYDDEEDDLDEFAQAREAEGIRSDLANKTRAQEDRAYYDDLAKKEDQRHNAMRKERVHKQLLIGEARLKLRHKEDEVKVIDRKIRAEEEKIELEKKRLYRKNAKLLEDGVTDEAPPASDMRVSGSIPVLARDEDPRNLDEEFSIERAEVHIKQMNEQKAELARVLTAMKAKLAEDERILSKLEHDIARM